MSGGGWRSHSEKLQDAHNKGESDAAEGLRQPPYTIAEVMGGSTVEEANEIKEAYDQGQRNHDSQSGT